MAMEINKTVPGPGGFKIHIRELKHETFLSTRTPSSRGETGSRPASVT